MRERERERGQREIYAYFMPLSVRGKTVGK